MDLVMAKKKAETEIAPQPQVMEPEPVNVLDEGEVVGAEPEPEQPKPSRPLEPFTAIGEGLVMANHGQRDFIVTIDGVRYEHVSETLESGAWIYQKS